MTTTATPDLNVKQTAAAMRRALREDFPGTRFSVRMDAGTAHGWITVKWQDGPSDEQVEAIVTPFQSAYFDTSDDGYRSIPQDGPVRYSCRGIHLQRSMTARSAALVAERINSEEPSRPARVEESRVETSHVVGGALSEEAATRLQVVGYGTNEHGEATVDVDLAAHQIFTRTVFAANSPANR